MTFTPRTLTVMVTLTLFQHPIPTTPLHGTKTTATQIQRGPSMTLSPMQAEHVQSTLLIWTAMATLTLFQHRKVMTRLHGTKITVMVYCGLPQSLPPARRMRLECTLRTWMVMAISILFQLPKAITPLHGTKTTATQIQRGPRLTSQHLPKVHTA